MAPKGSRQPPHAPILGQVTHDFASPGAAIAECLKLIKSGIVRIETILAERGIDAGLSLADTSIEPVPVRVVPKTPTKATVHTIARPSAPLAPIPSTLAPATAELLPEGERRVLAAFAMAKRADQDPLTTNRIAVLTGYSVRYVQNCVQALVRRGCLENERGYSFLTRLAPPVDPEILPQPGPSLRALWYALLSVGEADVLRVLVESDGHALDTATIALRTGYSVRYVQNCLKRHCLVFKQDRLHVVVPDLFPWLEPVRPESP